MATDMLMGVVDATANVVGSMDGCCCGQGVHCPTAQRKVTTAAVSVVKVFTGLVSKEVAGIAAGIAAIGTFSWQSVKDFADSVIECISDQMSCIVGGNNKTETSMAGETEETEGDSIN